MRISVEVHASRPHDGQGDDLGDVLGADGETSFADDASGISLAMQRQEKRIAVASGSELAVDLGWLVRILFEHAVPVLTAGVPQHLPGVLRALEPALDRYGYLAVAAFVVVEDFGVPVPGETVLILGAVYAGTGRLNVFAVGLIGFVAAVLGDNIGFAVGHFGGRRLVERFGRYVLLTPKRVDKATSFFERHGGKVVTVARFIEGLRQANGIIAGISGMHWARFLAFNALGAALWVGVWVSVGYFSGAHINTIYNDATRYSTYFAIAIVALVILYAAHRWIRHRTSP